MSFKRLASVALIAVFTSSLLAASQAPPPTSARSRTHGLKETEQSVNTGTTTSGALTDGRMQLQKTLGTYNGLVTQPSINMKGDYKKLLKAMDSMNDKVADARQKVEAMQKAGDTYF